MIAKRPAIDWLTLTTFSLQNAKILDDIMQEIVGEVETKEARLLQYDGVRGDGFFVGSGNQHGKTHYMFRFSGDLADTIMFNGLIPPMDCSRIDLQLTLPIKDDTYELFRSAEKAANKGRRKVNAIISSDGFCTLYIGSRDSEKFYRVYVKECNKVRYLRFEVEYKNKNGMAGTAYRQIRKDPTKATGLLAGEIKTLPDHPLFMPLKNHIVAVTGDIMAYEERIQDDNATMRWIARQVIPAWKRIMGNEDTRDKAIMLLGELVIFAKNLE